MVRFQTKSQKAAALIAALFVSATAGYFFLSLRMPELPPVTSEGIPLPFGGSAPSDLRGSILGIGQKGIGASNTLVPVRQVSFDNNEVSEQLQGATHADSIDFALTPNTPQISDGAALCDALTKNKKFFGYLYTSRPATTEKAAVAQAQQGFAMPFSSIFPGTFFASALQRSYDSFVQDFEMQKQITFVDPCAVPLKKDARYVIVANDPNVTLTVQGLSICGNGVVQTGEICDDGNKTSGDGCSSTCQLEASPWKNPSNPLDANNDGMVTNADYTQLTAYLNSDATPKTYQEMYQPSPRYPDVDGDYTVAPKDVLLIVNYLDAQCGNGNVQAELDETCDDGNKTSGDGCSATCQTESASWQNAGNRNDVNGDGVVDQQDLTDLQGYVNNPMNPKTPQFGYTPNPRYPDVDGNGFIDSSDVSALQSFFNSKCGNGIFETQYGEECDAGLQNSDTGACSPSCKLNSPI